MTSSVCTISELHFDLQTEPNTDSLLLLLIMNITFLAVTIPVSKSMLTGNLLLLLFVVVNHPDIQLKQAGI